MDGLLTRPSAFGAVETLARLETALAEAGLTVLARIDHAAGARAVGLSLRPTNLLIFGDPRAGTPLMARAPTIGIDLPLKALVWEDANDRAWLTTNDPGWLAARHHLDPGGQPTVAAMRLVLAALADHAAGEDPQ